MVRRCLTASLKVSLLAMVAVEVVLLYCLEEEGGGVYRIEEGDDGTAAAEEEAFCTREAKLMVLVCEKNDTGASLVRSGAARCIASSPCGSRINRYAMSPASSASTAPRDLAARSRMLPVIYDAILFEHGHKRREVQVFAGGALPNADMIHLLLLFSTSGL